MRIDAHQHFWRYSTTRDTWITPEMSAIRRDFLPGDLRNVLHANRVDGCVAVEAAPSIEQTRFLLDLANEHAFIRGVVGWVDLLAPSLDVVLEELCSDPLLVGVRHAAQAEADDFLARDDVVRGIGHLGNFGLAYDILIRPEQLPSALELASRLPNQRFVLDHLAKPRIRDDVMEPWATHIRELALRPNVHCKVSGLVTEAHWTDWRAEELRPYLDVVLEAFGVERVMFGSDWPVCLLAAEYGRVLRVAEEYTAALSAGDRAAFFGGNAARFYGLGR